MTTFKDFLFENCVPSSLSKLDTNLDDASKTLLMQNVDDGFNSISPVEQFVIYASNLPPGTVFGIHNLEEKGVNLLSEHWVNLKPCTFLILEELYIAVLVGSSVESHNHMFSIDEGWGVPHPKSGSINLGVNLPESLKRMAVAQRADYHGSVENISVRVLDTSRFSM